MTPLTPVPVEQVRVGDHVFVSSKIGVRRVAEIFEYDTLGLDQQDCFVILYDAPGPGAAWENRAGAKGVLAPYKRDVVSLRPFRRGETIQLARLHLVERS